MTTQVVKVANADLTLMKAASHNLAHSPPNADTAWQSNQMVVKPADALSHHLDVQSCPPAAPYLTVQEVL